MPGGLNKKKRMNYMGGGVMRKKAPMSMMYRDGGETMMDKTPMFKDQVQKMYGGGMTKKKLNYKGGGKAGTDVPDKMVKASQDDIKRFEKMGASPSEIERIKKEGVLTVTTVGKKRKRRLGDGQRSRGRRFDRSYAGSKFID